MLELQNKRPMIGKVKSGQFMYFLYKEDCVSCSMIISVTGTTSDGVELYINKGTKQPNKETYDIMKDFTATHIITINLSNTAYFKKNSLASMEGYYVLGILGLKDTSFQVSITSEEEPIATLPEGTPMTHSQKANEVAYFQYYHWIGNDVEIEVQVQSGTVDLLVSTFNPNEQDLVDNLPSKSMKTQWSIMDINSTNFHQGKELLILKNDRNFCFDCYYLLGLRTSQESSMYTLTVKSLEASEKYSNLLSVGHTRLIKTTYQGEEVIY